MTYSVTCLALQHLRSWNCLCSNTSSSCQLLLINGAILHFTIWPPSRQWWSRFKASWVSLGACLWIGAVRYSPCGMQQLGSFTGSSYLRDPPSSLDEQTLFLLCSTYCLQVHDELSQRDTLTHFSSPFVSPPLLYSLIHICCKRRRCCIQLFLFLAQ